MVEGPSGVLLVALAAFLNTIADSFVGVLVLRAGNEVANLLCTLTAAALTLRLI